MNTRPISILALLVAWHLHTTIDAADYLRDIQPLLSAKCVSCHGGLQQEAGLRLDHGEYIRRGSDSGSVLDLNQPNTSELMQRVLATDESLRMPPAGEGEPLTDTQRQLLLDWIRGGAESPSNEPLPADPADHWAWQPPQRVTVPQVSDADWQANPIDAFIFAKLSQAGLQPAPLAEPATLLRRVSFDLVGLPPTLAQQHRFQANPSNNAWQELVDHLLSNPAHGERWARHWMDVWRYSDWSGYQQEVRGSQRHIWRWRDWIIESLNDDKGYDRMVVEMLAADEVMPEDRQSLRATGFLVRNFHNSNRNIWLDATVEHTAKAFLALTLNCARCHDHKYDPLSQQDYYAFRAIFEPHHVRTERVPGQADIQKDGFVRAYDANLADPTYLYVSGDEKRPDKEHPIAPDVPSLFARPLEIAPVSLPAHAVFPALREFIEQEDLRRADSAVTEAQVRAANDEADALIQQQLVVANAELASLQARWQADKARFGTVPAELPPLVRSAVQAEHAAKVAAARLVVLQKEAALRQATQAASETADTSTAAKTEAEKALQEAEEAYTQATAPPAEDAEYTSVGKAYPESSTGRRRALATWIAHPENPLTARVAVNYVWMHHFGEPLVANVFDFGLRSPTPLHLDLLDWLAVEFMESGWSLKHLHRLIVTSRVYRLSSQPSQAASHEQNRRLDPNNTLWWRAQVRRLEAEIVRDSLLHIAGRLDQELGGPDIDFRQGETHPRRSVYFRHAYEKQMQLLSLFDGAAPNECYRRSPSVVPQQALALVNSPLVFDQSRQLASVLSRTHGPDNHTAFVTAAFRTILGRDCSSEELAACKTFLQEQQATFRNAQLTPLAGNAKSQIAASDDPVRRARESLVHTLFNHNDFITVR